ncbi:MAG: BrnT family toxin [Beijerinckiaceae bacterium]
MFFIWDAQKARKVLEERGLDFNVAIQIFAGNRLEVRSDQNNEERWLTIGELEGRCIAVVFTRRDETIRIITARRARKNEERAYYSRYPR